MIKRKRGVFFQVHMLISFHRQGSCERWPRAETLSQQQQRLHHTNRAGRLKTPRINQIAVWHASRTQRGLLKTPSNGNLNKSVQLNCQLSSFKSNRKWTVLCWGSMEGNSQLSGPGRREQSKQTRSILSGETRRSSDPMLHAGIFSGWKCGLPGGGGEPRKRLSETVFTQIERRTACRFTQASVHKGMKPEQTCPPVSPGGVFSPAFCPTN